MDKAIILCIDDDATILDNLEIELKKIVGNRYILEMAETGDDALEICHETLDNQQDLALVISDCIMPGLRGDQLLKEIHQLSPKTLTIMLTGQADLINIGNAIQYANLYRYIPKPWKYEDLALAVKEALNSFEKDKKISLYYQQILADKEKLAQQNEALRLLNQEKNEFLGIAAHDLKNPLSAIQGWSDMLLQDAEDMDHEEIKHIGNAILTSSRQMFELIKNLLDVNAIESGKINFAPHKIDLIPIVEWIVQEYKQRVKLKNIELHFTKTKDTCYIFADEHLTHQILDNLLSNAVKYSPKEKDIYVYLTSGDDFVCCEIQDQGPGLSQEDQKRLFDKFVRLTPRPTGGEHSTGLGLFIVKKLAEMMDIHITCDSELGEGSHFVATFPLYLN